MSNAHPRIEAEGFERQLVKSWRDYSHDDYGSYSFVDVELAAGVGSHPAGTVLPALAIDLEAERLTVWLDEDGALAEEYALDIQLAVGDLKQCTK